MGSDKKQELLGIRLKNGILIGKKGSKSTPSPTWKLGFENSSIPPLQDPNFSMNNSISARKIGANLWESQSQSQIQTQFNLGQGDGDGRSHHPHHRHLSQEKVGSEGHEELEQEDSPPPPVTPYVRALTPTGSVDFKDRFGESKSLKTSTHLLKVLNRIWNLEEQHSSNMCLVKVLKKDLEDSQAQIKTLLQERRRDRKEIEELKKSTQKSTIDELDVERKLRKHSESLHRKLSRELSDTRSSFSSIVNELKREKKARILLESLCDEFAKGIRDYEQKVRILQQNPEEKGQNDPDNLILRVSEAWLDERMQMKLAEAKFDFSEKKSISDNLRFEIEAFLQAKQKESLGSGAQDVTFLEKHDETRSCRRSLESFHLNEEKSTENRQVKSASVKTKHPRKLEPDVTVRELMSKTTTPDAGIAETSSKRAREGVKENTLMSKLLEARLESQLSRSRAIKR